MLSLLIGQAFDTAGQYDTNQAVAQSIPDWLNWGFRAGRGWSVAFRRLLLRAPARGTPPRHDPFGEPGMSTQTTDVLVIGSGFGGAIPAYYVAAGGARVTVLERGPRLAAADFTHSMRLGTYNKMVDVIRGDGVTAVAANASGAAASSTSLPP